MNDDDLEAAIARYRADLHRHGRLDDADLDEGRITRCQAPRKLTPSRH
jgi:hypothetical protein